MQFQPSDHHPASAADAAALRPIGSWTGDPGLAHFQPPDAPLVQRSLRQPVAVIHAPAHSAVGMALGGALDAPVAAGEVRHPLLGWLGPLYPEWLGDRRFMAAHGLRLPYVGGSMARGIASVDLAVALAGIGAMGMFGAAGLPLGRVEEAITRLAATLDPQGLPWGCNLIHSPNEPAQEQALVDLLLRHDVKRVEASAFMQLTPAVVRLACSGLHRGPDGQVQRRRHLFAKVSREEVAAPFLSPAPRHLLDALVAAGQLSTDEARLAAEVPVAEQIIVEADSGGHTDNRPLGALLPVIARLRDDLCQRHGYARPVHLGAAGGLGTPAAVASAFALGAAFVVVGSVHQATLESGVSDAARALLAEAGPADVAMTASADMFEQGVKVQVLSRGTLMPVRGNQLYELYRRHRSLDELPADQRLQLERNVFRLSLDEVWQQTQRFWSDVDPTQLQRAQADPQHRMALVFRWYLGQSSRWPLVGDADRRADYQLWCGPAMGAFNRWVAGSFLQPVAARRAQQVALNLLEGAAVATRAQQLRSCGVPVPAQAFQYTPVPLRLQTS